MKNYFYLFIFLLLSGCASEEACIPEICLNGGTSIDCQCECPIGFSGVNCEVELTPKMLVISKIELLGFPENNGLFGWDTTSKPDVFVAIVENDDIIYLSDYYENVDNFDTPLIFTPDSPIEIKINSKSEKLNFVVYDLDSGSDNDYMGGITFNKYEEGDSKLTKYIFETTSVDVIFHVSFKW